MKNILSFSPLSGFFLIGLAVLMSSCEDFFSQTVEIDPPPYEKQMALHLNLTNQDSSVIMFISRNYGILETVPNQYDYYVTNALASIYKDGQLWLQLADSTFTLVGAVPAPLQAGSTYELRVSHPDYPAVSATQVMPGDFTVDSARIKRNAATGQFGDEYDLVEVFMKDAPGERNFYEFALVSINYNVYYNPTTGMTDTFGVYEYPYYVEEYSDPNVQYGVRSGGLLSDQFFDGQSYKFQAKVYSSPNTVYRVFVRHVSEDYFNWSRSYESKINADDNPLVEPVSIFSNISGGLGIFSLRNEKVFTVF
ncbi:MAG: DUF4249 domain-containing protein [Saprospiraceae bacterium]|nr:DUF4249 domain-containing protein [Saprospiraceae bacterium]